MPKEEIESEIAEEKMIKEENIEEFIVYES